MIQPRRSETASVSQAVGDGEGQSGPSDPSRDQDVTSADSNSAGDQKEAGATKTKTRKKKPRSKRERMKMTLPDILDAEGAAEALGVSKRLVLRLFRQGELRGRKVGREWRVAKGELLRWLREPEAAAGPADEPRWLRGALDSGRATLGGKEQKAVEK